MSVSDNIDLKTQATCIQVIQQALALTPGPARIHVGFSGGLDSTVLLHWAWVWQQSLPAANRPSLHAIHINHQLLPQAEHWQQHCQAVCAQWGIEFTGVRVQVEQQQASLEQQARTARYAAFADIVGPNEVLLLAHHRDDQVETLLQRLGRGSGPLGLGAMTPVFQHHGITILRPLLELDRAQLADYAGAQGLTWVDDPSNGDNTMERNFLRNQVLPRWRQNRPQLNQTLARSARLCQETAQLLDQLAQLDLAQPRPDGGLPYTCLQPLDAARRNNLLRYWLRQQGAQPPSEVVLQRIVNEVVAAAADSQPRVEWGDHSVRRFQSVLYCLPQGLPEAGQQQVALCWPLDAESLARLRLPLGALVNAAGATAFSRAALQQGSLSVGFRQGGERLSLPARPGKALKDLFQELGVPPWLRGLWPILYCGPQIAGLPGLLVCEGFRPQSPDDTLVLDWVRNPAAQD